MVTQQQRLAAVASLGDMDTLADDLSELKNVNDLRTTLLLDTVQNQILMLRRKNTSSR